MVPPLTNMGRWPPGTAARNPSFCQPNAHAASSVSQSRLASEDAIDSCHGYHVHQASRLCCAGTRRRFQDAPRLVQVAAPAALEEALCSSHLLSVQPKRPERGTYHHQPALQSIEPMANLPCSRSRDAEAKDMSVIIASWKAKGHSLTTSTIVEAHHQSRLLRCRSPTDNVETEGPPPAERLTWAVLDVFKGRFPDQ